MTREEAEEVGIALAVEIAGAMKEIADGQSFKNIIRNHQIYVDKTQDIYNFLKNKEFYHSQLDIVKKY